MNLNITLSLFSCFILSCIWGEHATCTLANMSTYHFVWKGNMYIFSFGAQPSRTKKAFWAPRICTSVCKTNSVTWGGHSSLRPTYLRPFYLPIGPDHFLHGSGLLSLKKNLCLESNRILQKLATWWDKIYSRKFQVKVNTFSSPAIKK